jgi:curved DNA-binding protein CbpA
MTARTSPPFNPQPGPKHPPSVREIRTLARLLENFDYYQLLNVERDATLGKIRTAYHLQSRNFYPDQYLNSSDIELRDAVNAIAKRVKEAYAVLRHSVKRAQYDQMLDASGDRKRVRYTKETALEAQQAREEAIGKTAKGREFFRLAEEEKRKGNMEAALRNVQMALVYEPESTRFRALQEQLMKSQRSLRNRR